MIKVKDLVLAVGILAFFLLTDEKTERSNDSTEASIETEQLLTLPVDSLTNELDLYDSYADFTY